MTLRFKNNNTLLLYFSCFDTLKKDLIQPWKGTLIAKPLGRNVGHDPFEKCVREILETARRNGNLHLRILLLPDQI